MQILEIKRFVKLTQANSVLKKKVLMNISIVLVVQLP